MCWACRSLVSRTAFSRTAPLRAIPQPYTEESADRWVRHRIEFTKGGVEICFAIRDPEGRMLGSVGVDDLKVGEAHNGELGYWLTPAARGHGLATEAVRAFIPYAFGELGLERLTAHTIHFNERSIRLLQKNGFAPEGCLRRFTRTATGFHDLLVFGLLRDPRVGALDCGCRQPDP